MSGHYYALDFLRAANTLAGFVDGYFVSIVPYGPFASSKLDLGDPLASRRPTSFQQAFLLIGETPKFCCAFHTFCNAVSVWNSGLPPMSQKEKNARMRTALTGLNNFLFETDASEEIKKRMRKLMLASGLFM